MQPQLLSPSETVRVIGIMTGTSVDAIDVAVVRIAPALHAERPELTLEAFAMVPFSDECRQAIEKALTPDLTPQHASELHMLLAREYANAIAHTGVNLANIHAIGMHGQTLWHQPPVHTWQIGSGTALAALTGVAVVHDFRTTDVALGGQGAPLVPIFDWASLTHSSEHRVALNIGGIANVSVLEPSQDLASLRAFDTGPGNVAIDGVTRKLFGKRYDEGGHIALAGVPLVAMLHAMKSHPYFEADPPKTTGRETFTEAWIDGLLRSFSHPSIPSEDVVTTATELTAWSIADHIRRYAPKTDHVIASGGGSLNAALMQRLRTNLGDCRLSTSDAHGIPSQAKEAIAFAYIAWRTLCRLPSNLPSVTGASRMACLGSIAFPP